MRKLSLLSAVGCVTLAGALPALSQALAQPAAAAQASPTDKDPKEVVCETQGVLGSRLAKRRVCMTRAEWAELRREDRQALEKVQVQRSMRGE